MARVRRPAQVSYMQVWTTAKARATTGAPSLASRTPCRAAETGGKPLKYSWEDARAIVPLHPPSWPLFLRHLQSRRQFPLHSILSHPPSRAPQQQRDAPLAILPILSSQDLSLRNFTKCSCLL